MSAAPAEHGKRCPRCGAPLSEGSPEGMCARCLLGLGLEGDATPPAVASGLPGSGSSEAGEDAPERIGPYRLLSVLGSGGMGVVYLAEQEQPLRRRVALKLVKRGMDSKEVLARFESERQALALMDHPGIARVLDAGTSEDGLPYFVMEHVAGIPITEYCDRLSSRQRLQLFVEVCEAVQHAHTKGIIHRDIKPSNVLVSVQDSRPQPKVIDFGVAKAVSQRLTEKTLFTQLGVMIGTPGYMSPEQAEVTSLDVDTRSDIYSLGVLAYELLVGELPFDAKRLRQAAWRELQRIIQEEEPPKPSTRLTTLGATATDTAGKRGTDPLTLARELRGDLDWITLKALEKDRTRRYQSASELAADVRRHFRDEPVTAGPPGVSYRLSKAVKRHKLLFASGAAVATAVLAGLGIASLQYVRAEAARRETQRQVVRLHVAKGMELVDEGDDMAGLPWLVEALRLEEDETRKEAHRLRIGTTLDHLPGLHRLWAHDGPVEDAVFSPDGRAVASASDDKTARVWSVTTGEALSPPLHHDGPVRSVSFSPDGAGLLTGSDDGTARLWDVSTGRPLATLRHKAPVTKVAFSPQGGLVATASEDDTAILWNAVSGRAVATFNHGDDVNWVEFSRDGRLLVTAGLDGTRAWDVRTGRPVTGLLRHERFGAFAASLSPDGRKIVTTGDVFATHVWDLPEGKMAYPPLRHRFYSSWRAAFSPRGDLLAVGAWDNTLRLWSASTGVPWTPPIELRAKPLAVAFSPDGQLVVTADNGGRIRLWSASTGAPAGPPLRHNGVASLASFDPTGRWLLTAGEDGTVRVWDLATTVEVYPEDARSISEFTRDGRRIMTTGYPPDSLVRVWDSASGDPVTPPVRVSVAGAAVAAEGGLFATASGSVEGIETRLWDLDSGEPVGPSLRQPTRQRGAGVEVTFSPDGRTLAVYPLFSEWSSPGQVFLWDVHSRTVRAILEHDRAVTALSFSPDSAWIATGSADNRARVWDARTGSPSGPMLAHGAPILALAMSPDGARLATTSYDSKLSVWARSGAQLVWPARRVLGAPWRLSFSLDGTKLATGGTAAVEVWDATSGTRVAPPMMTGGTTNALRFSADGRWIVGGGASTTARVWSVDTGEPTSPRYKHELAIHNVEFSPDGKFVLTTRVHAFHPDQRPVSDLQRLAELLAGHRSTTETTSSPLSSDELRQEWTALSGKYPDTFEPSPTKLQSWHRERAAALAAEGAWEDAAAHLDRAIDAGPPRWRLVFGRGRARGELGRWDGAAADYGTASELIPGELEPAFARALIHLVHGERSPFEDVRRRLLEHWSHTQNPDRCRWAAHAMVLAPIGDDAARAQTVKWARIALETEPRHPKRLALYGAALLRSGRSAEAVAELEKARADGGAEPPPSALAFLALAARARGHAAEAVRRCGQAEGVLRRLDRVHSVQTDTEAVSAQGDLVAWEQRAELRALMREAHCAPAPSGAGAP